MFRVAVSLRCPRIKLANARMTTVVARPVSQIPQPSNRLPNRSKPNKTIERTKECDVLAAQNERFLKKICKRMTHLIALNSRVGVEPNTMLEQILEFTRELEERNIKFNHTVYLSLLIAYTRVDAKEEILSLFDRMDADNCKPSPEFFDKALHSTKNSHWTQFSKRVLDMRFQAEILDKMQHFGIRRTEKTYKVLFESMSNNYEPERALDTLEYMERVDKVTPSLACYRSVIDLCIRSDEPTLAFQLLQKAARSSAFDIHEEHLRMSVLRCAALNDSYKIVKECWQTAVMTKKFRPDDGTIHHVLRIASRFKDSHLASDVVQTLDLLGYPYRESHFTLLMEAFASTTDVRKCFLLLNSMRKTGVTPNKNTAKAIAHRLAVDKNAVERAQVVLDSLAAEKSLDVVAFNVVIHALAYHGLFDDAISVYTKASQLNVEPTVETLDSVLDACIHAADVSTGVQVYEEEKKRGIRPTASTMSKMVTLICTQDCYEEAFKYLEEMKDMGLIPLRGCYYKLVKKLAFANDPRLDLAIEDMRACGYEPSSHLETYVEKSTEYWNNVSEIQ
ncbi:hypothetical protein EC973_000800 [Apophysomyces ossiformis]|uniref:Pentatricopeptide repeat-containing protein-mitochondrial domain-containing protein n=1 Tax=Apophysomyces ossiformis TaxID=679940 RepID=A0A8H7BKP2_9FUNG|nr:hypothetical protein EC973_000800 [Apophysomyces ossiformis]